MPILDDWSCAPAELKLSEGEVHVWRAPLDTDASLRSRFELSLAQDEKTRASRFLHARDRDQYIVARGLLRELLGGYLKRSPVELPLCYGPHGKPKLLTDQMREPIRFNLSHSNGLAVYAFASEREVGIDLELVRPTFAEREVASRFFSDKELADLNRLPPEMRAEGFFLCWTRKEAYVKARGQGLQIPLQNFSVTLAPSEPAELLSADSARWTLRSFEPAPGYVAAVVGEGKDWWLRQWEWTP
jgi:4'-phosphopantetheinyl transferase